MSNDDYIGRAKYNHPVVEVDCITPLFVEKTHISEAQSVHTCRGAGDD